MSSDSLPSRPPAAALQLRNIEHRFGAALVVAGVDLETKSGEFIALLGPSGCGKTTLLRIMAGLLAQSGGSVEIGGRAVDGLPTSERGVGIVFQNYALFPHMTVAANVAYGLRARGVPASECATTVEEMLALVRMSAFGQRYPRELSGGQQQRIALARTLAVRPQVLLLDEPFAALDKNLRLDMQIEIKRIQRELGITAILVTHDQEEAMSMADRIAVMNAGRVEQFDTPEAVYDRPATLFVAQFVGTANLLRGRLQKTAAGFALHCAEGGVLAFDAAGPCSREGAVQAVVRPEHLMLGNADIAAVAATTATPDAPVATVEMALLMGASLVYELRLSSGATLKVAVNRHGDTPPFAVGQKVGLALRPHAPVAVFVPPVVEA